MKSIFAFLIFLCSGLVSAAVVVEPLNLVTDESGAAAQFRVYLDSTPAVGETVTINHFSDDVTEGAVSPGSTIFTEANYDISQYVTITPGTDSINDGDVQYQIINSVSSDLTGGNYDGASADDVTVQNYNVDGISIISVNPSSGIFISEGNSQVINISALGSTFGDMIVDLSTLSTDISLSTTSVTLTVGNGYSANITVTANDDAVVDGDVPFTIETLLTIPGDGGFFADPVDINGFTLDNDVNSYSIGGAVSGLAAGNSVTLQNNLTDDLVISSNSNFTFATQLDDGLAYDVSVLTQPLGQTCTVNNANGTVNGSDVNDVQVVCVNQSIMLDTNSINFGNVFVGSSQNAFVTVTNNGTVDVTLTGITSPAAPFSVIGGSCLPFSTVLSPAASCTLEVNYAPVSEGAFLGSIDLQSTAISSPDVITLAGSSSVQVMFYNVGGSVSGLAAGNSVTLQNNLTDNQVINSNSNFTFATQLADGSTYDVTVLTQPTGQSCSVNNGNGTLNGANVTDVQVVCVNQAIMLDTNSINFGNINVGSSQNAFVTVTNNGTVDVTLTGTTAPAAPFSIVGGSCLPFSTVLTPAASCTIELSFTPGAEGSYNGSFELESTAATSPDLISLLGGSSIGGTSVQAVPALNLWGLLVFAAVMFMFVYKRRLINH